MIQGRGNYYLQCYPFYYTKTQLANKYKREDPRALQLCLFSHCLHCFLLPMPSPLRMLFLQASRLHRSCCLFPSGSITSDSAIPACHCALLPARTQSQTSRAGWCQARKAALVPHQFGTILQLLLQKPTPVFKERQKRGKRKKLVTYLNSVVPPVFIHFHRLNVSLV